MPTTASINRITYGITPRAEIILKNGEKFYVGISDLADYVTKLTKEALENASKIDEADMNRVTISRLKSIDLAIVTIDPSMPFRMTECAFTAQLLASKQVCKIIIVLTKID